MFWRVLEKPDLLVQTWWRQIEWWWTRKWSCSVSEKNSGSHFAKLGSGSKKFASGCKVIAVCHPSSSSNTLSSFDSKLWEQQKIMQWWKRFYSKIDEVNFFPLSEKCPVICGLLVFWTITGAWWNVFHLFVQSQMSKCGDGWAEGGGFGLRWSDIGSR